MGTPRKSRESAIISGRFSVAAIVDDWLVLIRCMLWYYLGTVLEFWGGLCRGLIVLID